MSGQELKPCPFCGSKNLAVTASFGEWWVTCNGCLAGTNMCSSREAAFYRWNTRTPDPMLEELAGALEKLSVLGNGPFPGNSIGNVIAQQALENYRASKVQP